jgi:hypothetical protein
MFKPGDLVIVIKPSLCCGNKTNLGKVLTVTEEWSKVDTGHCHACNKTYKREGKWVPLNGYYAHESRLKKIEPLAETEVQEESLYAW